MLDDLDKVLLSLAMPHPRGYVCYRTGERPSITGRLDGLWTAARWTEDFLDIQGLGQPKPRFRTRVKMLWDDDCLYVGAELEEPHVWATLTKHDSVIFQDNDFEVFIDPDGDNHQYYEIEINALNTEWDLRLVKPYRDDGPALNEWEIPGFKSAIHVNGTLNNPADTDHGWCVEMAIPWKVLGEFANRPAPPREGDQWRVNFSRVEWQVDVKSGRYEKVAGKPEDNWVWSPQGVVDMHRPERWGYVQFTRESAASGRTVPFQPDPFHPAKALLHRAYYAQRSYKAAHGHWATSISDLKLPDSQNLTLQMTVDGFMFTHTVPDPVGMPVIWHIRQDSKIWREEPISSETAHKSTQ